MILEVMDDGIHTKVSTLLEDIQVGGPWLSDLD